jgi:hypothetical protein
MVWSGKADIVWGRLWAPVPSIMVAASIIISRKCLVNAINDTALERVAGTSKLGLSKRCVEGLRQMAVCCIWFSCSAFAKVYGDSASWSCCKYFCTNYWLSWGVGLMVCGDLSLTPQFYCGVWVDSPLSFGLLQDALHGQRGIMLKGEIFCL